MAVYDVIWDKALGQIESTLANFQFQIWFKNTHPFLEEDNIYYFEVSNEQHKKIMEQKYANMVQEALQSAYEEINGEVNDAITVCFVSPEEKKLYENSRIEEAAAMAEEETFPEPEPEPEPEDDEMEEDFSPPVVTSSLSGPMGLNPEHTFDTFVVGESNVFASNAALAVANSPGLVYNPLFLYGGVGLGKTHLMHAIGNAILKEDPTRKIVYVTSEKFTNELINMIGRTNANMDMREQFRTKYRKVDVLMIDDIQFIAGKDKTQDEFFHTFNELQSANKQIIISSDRPPHELEQLEARIVSRFEQGLICDIKMPDYETRVAILMNKASRLQRPGSPQIRDEVFHYIAGHPNANIRTLEGALKRVIAYADLNRAALRNGCIDEELARKALEDLFASQKQKNVSPQRVIDTVCEYYNVDEKDIRSRKKSKDIVFPRQVAMFIIRDMIGLSYTKIAEFFGKKDHTTVMHAEEKIAKDMRASANIKKDVEDLMDRLRSS